MVHGFGRPHRGTIDLIKMNETRREPYPTKPRAAAATLLFWAALTWVAWLLMMLVHEAGHVVAAWSSGGVVQRLVWTALDFSRTDVHPNPHPLIVAWAGPLAGCLLPLIAFALLRRRFVRTRLIAAYFAGFCLIANGTYIGIGAFEPIGDADVMLRHATPPAVMMIFGVAASATGLMLWHRASADANRTMWKHLAITHWRVAIATAVAITLLAVVSNRLT